MTYEIKKITKKRNGNFNLYLKNYKEEKIQIHKEALYKSGIYKLDEIDSEELSKVLLENENLLAKDYALKSLGYSAKTLTELRRKLFEKRFSKDSIEFALDFVKEKNLINEELVAKSLMEGKFRKNKYSKRNIQNTLRQKGISSEIISDLTSDIDSDEELEKALFYAEKKLRSLRNADTEEIKRKLRSTLSYRGFDYEIINKAIRKTLKNIDED